MNQAGAAGDQGAFREQGPYAELNRLALSETLSNACRPPSYTTVSASSLAIEETARKARAANYAHHTDCKSLVSTGDRPSVDETQLKYLEAQEVEDYDDSGDEPSIYVDASCVHDDLPSSSGNATYRDILRAIEDLQQHQESLRALHAEHDRKLEELLRQQPMVNKHLRVIRQNSIRGSLGKTTLSGNGTSNNSNNNSSSSHNTINNNDSISSSSGSTRDTSNKSKNSSSSSRNNTHNTVSNREQNNGNNGSCTNNSNSTSINSSRDASNHNKSSSTDIRNNNKTNNGVSSSSGHSSDQTSSTSDKIDSFASSNNRHNGNKSSSAIDASNKNINNSNRSNNDTSLSLSSEPRGTSRDQRKSPGSTGSSNDKNNDYSDSSRGNGNTSSSNNRKKTSDDNEVSSGSNNAGNENSRRRNCSDNGGNNEYANDNFNVAASGGEVLPQDQVIRRKTSRGGLRDDVALGAFQRFILSDSEQQSHIYFQLERLYSNFQRLHIPSKIVRTLMAENMAAEDPTTRQGVPPDHVTPSEQTRTKRDDEEETRLRHENEELKKKIEELQKEMEQIKKDKETSNGARRNPPSLPPKPRLLAVSNTSHGKPVLQNTKQQARKLKPTSPRPPPLQPRDIDIREISVQHKIEDYRQKFHQEVHYEGQKQVSSSFYTAHGGCRAQLEVFLNGNGTGRGRCMSLFVRVVPGEFDEFIKWPITLRIRATLMNQNRGLTHSVEDSGNQFQFSKPRTFPDSGGDDNCWGLVEFVTHEMISQPGFIKGDSIVLRCKIAFPSHLG